MKLSFNEFTRPFFYPLFSEWLLWFFFFNFLLINFVFYSFQRWNYFTESATIRRRIPGEVYFHRNINNKRVQWFDRIFIPYMLTTGFEGTQGCIRDRIDTVNTRGVNAYLFP